MYVSTFVHMYICMFVCTIVQGFDKVIWLTIGSCRSSVAQHEGRKSSAIVAHNKIL